MAHFLTPFNYEGLHDIHTALNGLLPPDIRVRELSSAMPEFHARFSVTGKIYCYMIYTSVWHKVKLVRQTENAPEYALGDLLKMLKFCYLFGMILLQRTSWATMW